MAFPRRYVSVPQFPPVPSEISRKLEDVVAGVRLMSLQAGEQRSSLLAQSSNTLSEAEPQQAEWTTAIPVARPIEVLLGGELEDEDLSMYGIVKTAATLNEVIEWPGWTRASSESAPFTPDRLIPGTIVLSTLKQKDRTSELEQKYQEMIGCTAQKMDAPAAIWSSLPVPYRSNHLRTGERFLCSRNGECRGDPADYFDSGAPIRMRPGRYGGNNAVSRKKEAERGSRLKLCAACYLAMKAGQD